MGWLKKANLRGPRGHGVSTARIDSTGHLLLDITDAETIDAGVARGPQGLPGMNSAPTDDAVAGLIGTPGTSLAKSATVALVEAIVQTTIFNVLAFGAVRGSSTDSSAAIQAAIDAAITVGGGTVLIPPGEYGVAALIRITDSNVTISGYGATLHRMDPAGDIFRNWVAGDVSTTGHDGASQITILGLTIDHHGDTYTGQSNVVTFNHCRNIIVRDVKILRTRGYHSLELNGVDGFLVDNCQFLGYDPGTQTGKEAIQIDCATAPTDSGAADETVTKNGTIRHCFFGGYEAMSAHTIGVGSHSHATAERYSNITIDDCAFDMPLTRAVVAYWWEDSRILACDAIVPVGSHGIRLQNSIRVTVSASTVNGPAAVGVTILEGSLDCKVIGCTILGATEGIYDGAGNVNTVIEGNTTKQTPSYGITVDASTNALVQGNRIDGAGYPSGGLSAIRFTGAAISPSATGNKASPHGVSGGTEVAAGISAHANVSDAWAFGNDFKGLAAGTSGTFNTTSNRI